jgi:hypothetical protein
VDDAKFICIPPPAPCTECRLDLECGGGLWSCAEGAQSLCAYPCNFGECSEGYECLNGMCRGQQCGGGPDPDGHCEGLCERFAAICPEGRFVQDCVEVCRVVANDDHLIDCATTAALRGCSEEEISACLDGPAPDPDPDPDPDPAPDPDQDPDPGDVDCAEACADYADRCPNGAFVALCGLVCQAGDAPPAMAQCVLDLLEGGGACDDAALMDCLLPF